MDTTDLSGPLTIFQTTKFEKADFRKMMIAINDAGGSSTLSRETFDRVFEMWWPQIRDKVETILKSDVPAKDANLRSDRELLEEILLTARSISRAPRSEKITSHIPPGLVKELATIIERILSINSKVLSTDLNDDVVSPLIQMLDYLNRASGFPPQKISERTGVFRKIQSEFLPF